MSNAKSEILDVVKRLIDEGQIMKVVLAANPQDVELSTTFGGKKQTVGLGGLSVVVLVLGELPMPDGLYNDTPIGAKAVV